METLPPEIIAHLIVNYMSTWTKFSFLLACEPHLSAYLAFAPSCDIQIFCDHFNLKSEYITYPTLCRLYRGLRQKLLKRGGAESVNGEDLAKSRYYYSIEKRKGILRTSDDGLQSVPTRFWGLLQSEDKVRDHISNSTFAYGVDADVFVMVHSLNTKNSATVTVFPDCNSFNLPFEVMGQDVLLKERILYLMPLPSPKHQLHERGGTCENLILITYDLSAFPAKIGHRAYWPRPRLQPQVYKESGERRLYLFEDKLCVILPSEPWAIAIYETAGLELIKTVDLHWFSPYILGQLFSSDQAGPHIVLAFFRHVDEDSNEFEHEAVIVTADLHSLEVLRMPNVIINSTFLLDKPVAQLQLFLVAASDYRINAEGKMFHHSLGVTSKNHRCLQGPCPRPLIVALKANGTLLSTSFQQEDAFIRKCPNFKSHGTIVKKGRYIANLWEHNELIVSDERVFVMHKLTSGYRVAYATSLDLARMLWLVNLDSTAFGLRGEQRLFLHCLFGLFAVSDASGLALFDRETGLFRGHRPYDKYEKILPELESISEDTSPYAQTGHSIWDLGRFSNGFVIVHDIERTSPTIVDIVDLLCAD